MKKLIILITILFLSTSLSAIEKLKSLDQLKQHKIVFLVFERNGCPWCYKYKDEIEVFTMQKYKYEMKFFKIKKGSEVFSAFIREFNKKIIIYPMTYIIKLNKDNNPKIIEETYGYQREEYLDELIQKVLKK